MATSKYYTWLSCGVSLAMGRLLCSGAYWSLIPWFPQVPLLKVSHWLNFLCILTVVAFCSDTSSRCSDGRRRCSSNRRTTAGHHGGLAFAPFIPVSYPTFKCKNSQGDVKCYIYGWVLSKEQSFGWNILKMMITPLLKGPGKERTLAL